MIKKLGLLFLAVVFALGGFMVAPTPPVHAFTNHPPIADTGGPYVTYMGGELRLDGSASLDPDLGDHITNYEWDLNGDGVFTDASGAQPRIQWADLAPKLQTPAQYPADPRSRFPKIPLSLRVTDAAGSTAVSTTTLTIYKRVPFAVATWGPMPAVPILPDGTAIVHLDGSASYHGAPDYHVVDWAWQVKGTAQWVHGEEVDMQVDLKSGVPPSLPDPFPFSGITKTLVLRTTDELGQTGDAEFDVTFKRLPSQPPDIKFNVDRGGIFIEQGEGFSVSADGTTDPDGDWIRSIAWDIRVFGINDIVWSRTDTNGDGVVDGNDAGPNYWLQMTWAQMASYPGFQAPGQHTIRLTVTDSTGVSASDTVSLTIVEKAMFAKATVSPAAGNTQTLFTFDGSLSWHLFPGQSVTSWQWDFNNDGVFEAAGQTVQYTFDSVGIFPVTLKVMDAAGHSNTDTVQVTTWDVNHPPVANPGGPYVADLDSGITLDGSGSYDPNAAYGDSIVSYQWQIGSALILTGPTPTMTAAQVNTLGVGAVRSVSLTVTDSFGATGSASTTLTVQNVNHPPVANPGGPYVAVLASGVVLYGFGSSDPDAAYGDSIVSYQWNISSGALILTGPTENILLTAAQVATLGVGIYPVSLTVTDSFGATGTASTTLTVQSVNHPPVANAGGPYLTLPGRGLTLDGSQSYDSDAPYDHVVDYLWDLNNDGVTDATGSNPSISDAQIIALGGNNPGVQLHISLKVTDTYGITSNPSETTINIVENHPPVAEAGPNQTVEQTSFSGGLVTLDGSGSTDDGQKAPLTYNWTWAGGSVSGVKPQVSLPPGHTTVTLAVYDGEFSASDSVAITVMDTTPPTITAPANVTVEQTSPAGVASSSLSTPTVSDAADPHPVVTNNAPPVLPPGVTTVTWTAMDASGNMARATQKVTVQDTTPPTITAPANITVQQNNPGGATINSLGTPTVSDAADPNPVVTNNAPAIFPLGVTTVTWTATDTSGNSATATQAVTVTFVQNQYTLTVIIVGIGSGTVTKNPDQATYTQGTTVQLQAVSPTGYHFVQWSGDLTSTENPRSILMDGNKTVTAIFAVNTNTTMVTVQLKDSNGNPLNGGVVQYYSGGWKTFGTTDASGQVSMELLPLNYSFSMTYAGGRQEKSQNAATNPTVAFQTTSVTVQLKDSAGNPMDIGTAQYYAGGWKDFGTTSGGQVSRELLPLTYSFSMTYGGGRQEKSQNAATNPTVAFQTGQVYSDSGSCTKYYAGGWLTFTQNIQLLPLTYTFHFNDGTPDKSSTIISGTINHIH